MKCAPAPAKRKTPGSKLIGAHEIPQRQTVPAASAPHHDSRRISASSHPPGKPTNLVPIAAGAAAVVLLLGFVFLSGNSKPTPSPLTNAHSEAPPGPTRDSIAAPTPAPTVPTRVTSDPEPHIAVPGPSIIKNDDPETKAGEAFEKLRKFEGLDAADKAGRIKRLEEFAATWLDTLAAARARTMIDELKKPREVPVAPADKTGQEFATAFNYALAANGGSAKGSDTAALLIDGNTTVYDRSHGYGVVFALPKPMFVVLKEAVEINCIRVLLWDHDDRFYRYKLDVCEDDLEKSWTPIADKSDTASQCKSWQTLKFAPRKVKVIRLTGTHCSLGDELDVVELQAFNLAAAEQPVAETDFSHAFNFALASNGGTAHGGKNPNLLIDGNSTTYDGGQGFAYATTLPQSFIVSLKEPVDINCIRFLLWDHDERFYRYKLEVCADDSEKDWTMIADKSDEKSQCKSWQTLRFQTSKVKLIRLTGTYNLVMNEFHVVELQAFKLSSAAEATAAGEPPKPSPNDTVLLAESFDGPTCDGLFFGELGEGPAGSHGKVMVLKGTNSCSKGIIASWALKPGWKRKGEFPITPSTRIRFRYYNGNARHFGFNISLNGEEKAYARDLDVETKNAWLNADFAVSDLTQVDTGNKVKEGSVFNSILFETWGNSEINAYVDDLWIGNPAPPASTKKIEAGSASKTDKYTSYDDFLEDFRSALRKRDRTEAAAVLSSAEAADALKNKHSELEQDGKALDWLAGIDAAVTAGAEKLKDADQFELRPDKGSAITIGKCGKFQFSEVKDGVLYVSNNEVRLPIVLSSLDLDTRDQLAQQGLENDEHGGLLRAFLLVLKLDKKAPAFQISAARSAIDKAQSASAPPELASLRRHLDEIAARQQGLEKTEAAAARLEADAMREWTSINGLVDSGKWDQGDAALAAFKQKYAASVFAAKKGEEIKALLEKCFDGLLSKGLVGYWKFDEGHGTFAADSSGRGNTAVISGAKWVPGKFGTALSFNGTDDFAEVTDNPGLRITDNLTISLWFKDNGNSRPWARLACKAWFRHEQPWMSYAIFLDNGPEGGQKFKFQTSNSKDKWNDVLSTSLATAQWRHVVGVFDSTTSKISIYVDGVKEGEAPIQNPGIAPTTGYFRIGDDAASKERVKGFIDEVRLYNRALSDAEVKTLFNGRKPKD